MSVRRLYETTFIVNAALEDAETEGIVKRVTDYIVDQGGQLVEVNKWGRRRLAYPIKKKYNGYYVYCAFEAPAAMIPLLERFFVLEDNVLRHLTVQLDPKLREFRKVRAEAQALRAAQMAESGKTDQPSGGRRYDRGDRYERSGGDRTPSPAASAPAAGAPAGETSSN